MLGGRCTSMPRALLAGHDCTPPARMCIVFNYLCCYFPYDTWPLSMGCQDIGLLPPVSVITRYRIPGSGQTYSQMSTDSYRLTAAWKLSCCSAVLHACNQPSNQHLSSIVSWQHTGLLVRRVFCKHGTALADLQAGHHIVYWQAAAFPPRGMHMDVGCQ